MGSSVQWSSWLRSTESSSIVTGRRVGCVVTVRCGWVDVLTVKVLVFSVNEEARFSAESEDRGRYIRSLRREK